MSRDAGTTRFTAFRYLSRLLQIVPGPRWATPALVALGLGSSFAETTGISLIILFIYSAMGQIEDATLREGLLGRILGHAGAWFDSPAQMAIAILALIVVRGGLAFANNVINAYVSERISERARNLIHEQYLTVSYAFVRRHQFAHLMEVLGTESWFIANAYGSRTKVIVSACAVLVFLAFLFALSWQLSLAATVGATLVSIPLRGLSWRARDLGRRVKQVHQDLGRHMLVTLQGLRTIRAYGQEKAHQQRFQRSSAEARRVTVGVARLSALIHPLSEVGYLAILCVVIASSQILGVTFATTLAAVALLYRLQPHLRDIERHLLYTAGIEPQLRSVLAMLERGDKAYPAPGHRPIDRILTGVRFEHARFEYERGARPALDSVTFRIPAGMTTALVGASGAGKTTVINLLLRLYEPTAGSITVDGVPLDEIRRSDWLALLAVAGQDVDLVEGTVMDNIRMAGGDASDEAVVAAAQVAGAHEFIEDLPGGYNTWIGQQGMRLSGGQRQRVGLARAVLREPAFLLLDEATNALEPALERRIRAAIRGRFNGSTILVITHRPESVTSADHVVCIEGGRVVAEGAPHDLLTSPESALSKALATMPDDPVRGPATAPAVPD
ncbi:MAG: ABC transporter ATP-binding protein/permease [Burkholderiales bacterium]|jgi:ABC-type multidrug transport system fused ATPase/permease subunit|nr:ABC transporter ATP-binding protein/permease [Burkholderiales bacterium]